MNNGGPANDLDIVNVEPKRQRPKNLTGVALNIFMSYLSYVVFAVPGVDLHQQMLACIHSVIRKEAGLGSGAVLGSEHSDSIASWKKKLKDWMGNTKGQHVGANPPPARPHARTHARIHTGKEVQETLPAAEGHGEDPRAGLQ